MNRELDAPAAHLTRAVVKACRFELEIIGSEHL
jgi:hypothetical protein